MADIKWIKICTDIFDDEKILLIEAMPDKYAIITAWFKLLCLAGKQNNSGVFLLNDSMPYTDEMFATIFRMPLNTVRLALETFQRFGMIEIIDNVITIPNWGKHQSMERLEKLRDYQRQYHREYRKKQALLAESKADRKVCVNDLDIETDKEEIREDKKTLGVFQTFAGDNKELLAALKEYNEYRNKKKKPLTDNAKTRLCKKLEREIPSDQWVLVIQQSIDQGWTDIYPLKAGKTENRNSPVSNDPEKWNTNSRRQEIADFLNG